MAQPHEVRLLSGAKIDWHAPPKSTAMCTWTKRTAGGRKIKASLRTLCHLNRLNNLALHKFGTELVVIQPPFNTTVAASAGTHDFDATWDLHIPGVGWWTQQRFFRANGLGCWYRHPPKFGNHIHGFTLPPHKGDNVADDFKQAGMKVGKFVDGGLTVLGGLVTSSQIVDYYRHAFGLSGQHTPNSDTSWFPASISDSVFDLADYIAQRAT